MPFESRRRARDEKREAVLRTAVQLFLEQGYHRVTLNDVADRLNITKPALYNYFRGKDEILFECWALGQERVDELIAEINRGGGTALAKLRKLVHAYAGVMTTDYGASLVRFDPRDLTEENRKTVAPRKSASTGLFANISPTVSPTVRSGPCDPKLAAFAIAGSLNWIGHWYQRDGAWSADDVARQFTAQLTEGLAKAPARKRSPSPTRKSRPASGGRK
jgi:AcrR family transcriptional regulator